MSFAGEVVHWIRYGVSGPRGDNMFSIQRRSLILFGLLFGMACQSVFQEDVDVFVDPATADLGEIDPLDQPYAALSHFSCEYGLYPVEIDAIALSGDAAGWMSLEDIDFLSDWMRARPWWLM